MPPTHTRKRPARSRPRSMRLVLFDIDGTLLREGLAPKIAFARAL